MVVAECARVRMERERIGKGRRRDDEKKKKGTEREGKRKKEQEGGKNCVPALTR